MMMLNFEMLKNVKKKKMSKHYVTCRFVCENSARNVINMEDVIKLYYICT